MIPNININEFVNEKFLKKYFKRLYKICRSILGDGFRESLEIIGEIVDLKKKKLNMEQKFSIGQCLTSGT